MENMIIFVTMKMAYMKLHLRNIKIFSWKEYINDFQ